MRTRLPTLGAALALVLGLGLMWWMLQPARDQGPPTAVRPTPSVAPRAPTPPPMQAARAPEAVPPAPVPRTPAVNPDGDSERDAEAPEVTAAWLEDMGLMIVSAVEPELDADEVETECSDDGRTCWIRGPLTTVEGHHALMSRVQEAIASGVLSPRDVTELAVSALSAEAWDDGRPGFALEVSLDP